MSQGLSFVVPAYNEEDFIEGTLCTLERVVEKNNLPYEILVVDDGSADKTLLRANSYAAKNKHVKVLTYPKNMGKGYAIKTGFFEASGDIVFFVDGDMEIQLSTIWEYVVALQHGDIVIASKKHSSSHVEVPLSRKVLSACFNGLVRLFTGIPLRDTQSGLKAMRKDAFNDLFPRLAVKRYAFDVELLTVANLYGLKVVEMPVCLKLDAKFKAKEMWHMFLDLLGIAYRLRVIHWYQRSLPEKNGFQNMVSYILKEQ
jgi:glycosyltransferase involved in cell wall biosynthesis